MSLLNEDDKKYLINEFEKKLKNDVELLHFTDKDNESEYFTQTIHILKELSELDERIKLTVKDCKNDKEEFESENLELCPATMVKSEHPGSILFYGSPGGYEFSSLVESIINMSTDSIELSNEIQQELSEIQEPVDIKVFVTPSCPYCPRAVKTAHQFSMANENITGAMVEAHGFPELSRSKGVSSVPHIVVNEEHSFVGALPDEEYLKKLKEAL